MPKGVRDIRRRIRSIKATQQITRAMQMVAAVKMRRAQEAALRTRAYVGHVVQLLGEIAERGDVYSHALLHRVGSAERAGKTLVVVISSNRGLAGGLNANLLRAAQDFLTVELDGAEADVVTLGRKAFESLTRGGTNVVADFSPIPDNLTFGDISPLTNFAIKGFMATTYARVFVISTHFVSTLVQKSVVKQVMPLGKSLLDFYARHHADAVAHPERTHDFLFEPDPQTVLDGLLPQIAEMQIYQSVLEAQASEHSARMVAMKNATEAAGDIIDDLSFTANQLRQSSITQEISEITSGVNALS